MKKSIACCYHNNDLDGITSAAIVAHYLENDVDLYGMDYGETDFEKLEETLEDYFTVYIVDLTLGSVELMKKLAEVVPQVIWIDHHGPQIERANELGFNPKGLRVVGYSACELCWVYFNKQDDKFELNWRDLPSAIYLIGRYDVWDHNADPKVLPFQYGARLHLKDPISGFYKALIEDDSWAQKLVDSWSKEGETILAYQKSCDVTHMEKCAFVTSISGHKTLAINGTPFQSSLSFQSHPDADDVDMFAKFFYLKNGRISVSLYTTKKNVNVAQIARVYGGGGHVQAAGFTLDREAFFLPMVARKEEAV